MSEESLDVGPQKELLKHIKLLDLSDRFLVDLECLRDMHSSVLPVLKEQDKERQRAVSEVAQTIAKEEEATPQDSPEESGSNGDDDGGKRKRIRISSYDLEEFISNLRKMQRAELLFSKQAVVSFVSRYDEFFGQLLGVALERNPSWLASSEKTISYKELIEMRSIDTAVQGVILKEVDRLLRGSHEEQINYIDERLKIGVRENFTRLPEFLEVAERRNLFVHTGGVVSQQYLDKCANFGHRSEKALAVGDELSVAEGYFEQAFSIFFELGLRIGQAAYRRLFPEKLAIADRALNKLAIRFLNYGDNELAVTITDFDLSIPDQLRSDGAEYKYFATVNRAIAQKRLGHDFESRLEGVPWAAFHPKYHICLHALRDEFSDAAKLMHSEEVVDKISITGFRTWPVFREFRASEEFKVAYREVFGEPYVPDPERDAAAIAKQEDVVEEVSDPSTNSEPPGVGGDAS